MKIVFFGRGSVALPSLLLLQQQSWCQVMQIVTTADLDQLEAADVGVVIDYGHKISAAVRSHFPCGVVNLHPSLLPRWRGPSPIKSALLHGDTKTGVSIMVIDDGFDTGPILAQTSVEILETETNAELEPRLAQIGAELLIDVLPKYVADKLQPFVQTNVGVTISKLIQRQDGEFTTNLDAKTMWNRYRAFQPWPGVFFLHQGKRYKITKAHLDNGKFVCDEIQPEGKRTMPVADFKRGYTAVSFANIL